MTLADLLTHEYPPEVRARVVALQERLPSDLVEPVTEALGGIIHAEADAQRAADLGDWERLLRQAPGLRGVLELLYAHVVECREATCPYGGAAIAGPGGGS